MWKLDACVKARVLVDLVCLMTTLKECVRRFFEVPASQWLEQAGNWTCQKLRCGMCCVSCYVLNRTRCDWCRPLHQQSEKRDFCEEMQLKMEENDFVERLIFCDEAIIPYQWQGERTQCPYLGNRATTCTDRAPA